LNQSLPNIVENTSEKEFCDDTSIKSNKIAIDQKRKEIQEKIDKSGLADTLRNLFKN